MPLSKKLGAYQDVVALFTTVLEHSGGELTFPTPGKAIQFRQRAYYYRNLLVASEYDCIKITLDKDRAKLTFEIAPLDATFITPEGHEVEIDTQNAGKLSASNHLEGFDEEEDDLLAEALALVKGN